MSAKFQKRKEDFICEKCGFLVKGNGFTNHCPKCLWGKHVDVNPGDRLEICGGLMEPIRAENKSDKYYVIHRCTKCGVERTNSVSRQDDFDVLIKIAEKYAKNKNS